MGASTRNLYHYSRCHRPGHNIIRCPTRTQDLNTSSQSTRSLLLEPPISESRITDESTQERGDSGPSPIDTNPSHPETDHQVPENRGGGETTIPLYLPLLYSRIRLPKLTKQTQHSILASTAIAAILNNTYITSEQTLTEIRRQEAREAERAANEERERGNQCKV